MQPKEREKLLVYFQSSGEAIDWDALQSKLAEIRTQGYSITINELDEGAHSITAPIFDSQGKVIAAAHDQVQPFFLIKPVQLHFAHAR